MVCGRPRVDRGLQPWRHHYVESDVGFLPLHRQHAIANVLPAHADDIVARLSAEKNSCTVDLWAARLQVVLSMATPGGA